MKMSKVPLAITIALFYVASTLSAQESTAKFVTKQLSPTYLNKAKKLDFMYQDIAFGKIDFNEGMCPLRGGPNELYGFVDVTGNLAIPFQYTSTGSLDGPLCFSDGVCVVGVRDGYYTKQRYIDKTGKVLFDNAILEKNGYKVAKLQKFSEGVAFVWLSPASALAKDKGVFIDKKGNILPGSISIAKVGSYKWEGFSDGLAPMKNDEAPFTPEVKYGFINKKGQWAIKPAYSLVKPFSEGMAAVYNAESKRWGFINTEGKLVIPYRFSKEPSSFHEDVCVVTDSDDFNCIIDKKGEIIFQGTDKLGKISDFGKGGIAVVGPRYLNYRGIINKAGKVLYYKEGDYFSGVDLKSGDIHDGKGIYVLNPLTNEITRSPKELHIINTFSDGLVQASFKKDGKDCYGIVDRNYDVVLLHEASKW